MSNSEIIAKSVSKEEELDFIDNSLKINNFDEYIENSENLEKLLVGKKWFFFGIGGAGHHVLDSIIFRQDSVQSDEYLKNVWDAAIEDYVLLDTNPADIFGSFIAEKKNWDDIKIEENCRLKFDENKIIQGSSGAGGTGAGNDYEIGEMAMKHTIDAKDLTDSKLTQRQINQMKSVQAVMIIHSTTSGTGCGASPVLADYLKNEIVKNHAKLFSMTVLPAIGEITQGMRGINGVVGLAKMLTVTDGIYLVDNTALSKKKSCHIKLNMEEYDSTYTRLNRHIIEFLENFSLSSSIGKTGAIGNQFDVNDAITLARNEQKRYEHAPILVPATGSIPYKKNSDVPSNDLRNLFINTIIGGKLATCDHKKAKGGSFVILGPKEAMKQIHSKYIFETTELSDIIREEHFFNNINEDQNILFYNLSLPNVNRIYMWGLLWNPPLKLIDIMLEKVNKRYENPPNKKEKKRLEKVMGIVKDLHENLGTYEVEDEKV